MMSPDTGLRKLQPLTSAHAQAMYVLKKDKPGKPIQSSVRQFPMA
jgi:hypothetical protein